MSVPVAAGDGALQQEVVAASVLLVVSASYAYGARRLLVRRAARFGAPNVVAFAAAAAVISAALIGPLDARAAERFSAHMVQHLLLMLVVAPLLVAARPVRVLGELLGRQMRRAIARAAGHAAARAVTRVGTNPFVVWSIAAAVLWAWHLPVLYEAALRNDLLHFLEHGSLLVTAGAFWGLVGGIRYRLSRPAAVLLVFATALQSGALGAVLVFASTPLYPLHGSGVRALADQQLAGALMWVPSGFVYLAVMALFLYVWFSEMERGHPDASAVSAENP